MGAKLKICMISYSQFEDDSRIQRYTNALVERKIHVDIICLGKKGQNPFEEIENVGIYRILTRQFNEKSSLSYLRKMLYFFLLASITCTRLFFKYKYTFIHFHNIPDFGIFCTIIPKFLGAKILFDIHDFVPEFYQRKFHSKEKKFIIKILKWFEKSAAFYADHVLTVHEIYRKKLISRSVKAEKCTVILNAPDEKVFCPQKIKKDSSKILLSYHGNLAEPTGVDLLVRAFDSVRKSIPYIKLQIIGQGLEENILRQLIHELSLENYIEMIKTVSVTKIPYLIQKAHIGIDPKRDGVYAGETLSVKALEYLAMDIPLVVSRTKVASHYFSKDMVTFFKPGDVEDLTSALLSLIQSNAKRINQVKEGRKLIKQHHWENYKNAYFQILNKLLDSKKY